MAHGARHVAGLIVNALALQTAEATDAWLLRTGLTAPLSVGLPCSLLSERGLKLAARHECRGMTFAFLHIQLLVGMDLPSRLVEGLECGP